MDNRKKLALKVEKLSVAARLHDVALFMSDGEIMRAQKILAVLEKLDPGVYLIGSGPYSQGVFSLMVDEVVIGRNATPLERILDKPIDVFVNDAATLTPREVSRVHCSIYRAPGTFQHDYFIIDRGSTCGTFLNSEKLETPTSKEADEVRRVSRGLNDGDVISLGTSAINTFVFADLRGAGSGLNSAPGSA
jgi:pSer/pThr/pTyr-binding forkhead associated (FHA) protein